MRNVNPHLLEDKMDEAVTHYITHQPSDSVHVDANSLALNIQEDEGGRVVTVMPQNFSQQMCRQVSVGEHVEGWGEEMLDPDGRLAAIVAQLAKSGASHYHPPHKLTTVRGDMETSVMLDGQLRLFNAQTLEQQGDSIVVQMPSLPPLPPLQEMKRYSDADWVNKSKNNMKTTSVLDSEGQVLELPDASPGQNRQQSKKSLPHKKRISRKLKRNTGNTTPQQDIVVISCNDEVQQEEILPDNYVTQVQHQTHLADDTHNITHEVRPVLICCICGEYYGEEQLKFYQHLKHHYEPHSIIIENPVSDLGIDKMTNTCIEDNVANLPDSIVELSLENTVPKTMYQTIDKHILYTSSDKTLQYSNKVQYSMASMDKEPTGEKGDLYDTLDKLEMYNCMKCNKTFRKQKQCEAHIKEVHGKLEDMSEFSEPEDLMEGIHVAVEGVEPAEGEAYEQALLPHLTVENGTVHQEHVRHWYMRGNQQTACGPDAYCPVCPERPDHQSESQLKEEVFQRIFDVEVPAAENSNFGENIIPDTEIPDAEKSDEKTDKGKKGKSFECPQCGRVFQHRNSLLYHVLSHKGKQHVCRECNKGFYTSGALKIHKRVHNGDRPYKCEECDREFRQWSDLKYHKVSLHSNQKHFKCEFCSKEFARKYSLSVHRRIHTGERNYKCEYCNKSFRASSYRLSHMRTHTGDKPFKCVTCGKGFRVAGDLRRHALTHDKLARDKLARVKHEPDKSPKKDKNKEHKKKPPAATKLPILKSILDKKSPKSKKKIGAPNVTVDPDKEQFKINNEFTNNVEVFDSRNFKFKEIYVDKEHLRNYEIEERLPDERNFAVLKPMFRANDHIEPEKVYERTENTDGKMAVFTQVEKKEYSSIVSNTQVTLADINRHLEREPREVRSDSMNGEAIENGILERLAALYNIPAV
ncbi:protein suppressor of hairy wing-like [Leguminivora glycinivorella]|uniref:protein suppressor of hairy wing-like n=1 Tax=Leguminivora glycinivorella TaxID=1035111 RepID=UPI00200CF77E|nr:protein suppressor of hairy wing-like [Leguminivora glycinivorella]